ncbi:hypothetical protein EVAR_67668_1 [Eumeta japonica]|uniref:Uncharacterized protein n=1 Tax=Eumeta variegata TaxID=151549 RepID=A0A4C1ZAW5_EUMVA|nr:hypothetical protein EVAR_67668_1 [Eumeta japonica]
MDEEDQSCCRIRSGRLLYPSPAADARPFISAQTALIRSACVRASVRFFTTRRVTGLRSGQARRVKGWLRAYLVDP